MADIILSQITKSFAATQVLHGISLEVASGEFVSLLGASGCGKTTLLRIVAGLETVTSGTVSIADEDVTGLPPERRDIAMMFQSYALLPHLSVLENIRFPLRMRAMGNREEQMQRAREALETVQLGHLGERRPSQLSGGQQQRVALARAVVSRPKVLLLDEPLSNLDARLREDMQVELIEIHKRLGLTTLFVTHDQDEALSLSDRVVLINQGRIEQMGPPAEIYDRPQSAYASAFLGAANLLPATIEAGPQGPVATLGDGQTILLAGDVGQRGPVVLCVRQEDIAIAAQGGLAAKVRARVFLGSRCSYVTELGGTPVRLTAASSTDFAAGDTVGLTLDPQRIRILPAQG